MCNIIGPDLASLFQLPSRHRNLTSLCIFHKYFHTNSSNILFDTTTSRIYASYKTDSQFSPFYGWNLQIQPLCFSSLALVTHGNIFKFLASLPNTIFKNVNASSVIIVFLNRIPFIVLSPPLSNCFRLTGFIVLLVVKRFLKSDLKELLKDSRSKLLLCLFRWLIYKICWQK